MNLEKIKIDGKEFETFHKVFLINADQFLEYEFTCPPIPSLTFKIIFKDAEKPAPVQWDFQNDKMLFTFIGWNNPLGMISVKEMGKLGNFTVDEKSYILHFKAATHSTGQVYLLHLFFYLETLS